MSVNLPAKPFGADLLKAAACSIFVLVLTSVHHLYGAVIYETPWRMHVVYFSIPAAILIASFLSLAWRYRDKTSGRTAAWLGVALAFAFPVGVIGVYEGGYNHLVKNVLYFGGATGFLSHLFPPPDYELPNNVFFELTGVAQLFTALVAGRYLLRLSRRLATLGGPERSSTVRPGTLIARRELVTIQNERVSVPDAERLVHLQFRRFAGCPVCNLHLQSVVRRHDEIVAAGIREVVVFHSTRDELLAQEADLPFAVIADPGKKLYVEFGVESSIGALLDPRAWIPILRAIFNALPSVLRGERPAPSINPHGGRFGLPADFLITNDGCILACKYGTHADDQWSVDEVLQLSRSERECERRLPGRMDSGLNVAGIRP